MARGYFTVPISENLEETPEGFLIARGCVIARTGWQKYKVGDLPQDSAAHLGVDVSRPQDDIEVYRPAEEVFAPDTLRSFEGKPVTDNHPQKFVTPENFSEHSRGHVQNVRKGVEPLESGDWPMLGDVHVMAEPLLSKVRNKVVRELSCGYDYGIRKEGEKICQVEITGNHVAVVPKGRAGNEARINDSAAPSATSTATASATTAVKEKPMNWKRYIQGLGLRAIAADAETKPEDLVEAAHALHEEPEAESEDRKADDRKTDDRKADDRKKKGRDRKADDRAKRLHDALDRMLEGDSEEKEEDCDLPMANDAKVKDVDLEELKALLNEYFSEEEEEPEHAEDEEEEEEEESEAEDEEEEEGKEGPGEVTEKSGKEEVDDRASAADGVMATLRALRPVVARSNDAAVRNAFNKVLSTTTRSSKQSDGGYGKFANVSRARDRAKTSPRGRAADGADDRIAKMQAFYDDAHKQGGK